VNCNRLSPRTPLKLVSGVSFPASAPRLVCLSNGGDAWIVESQPMPMLHTGQNLTGAGPVKFASGRYTDEAGRPVPEAGDGLQRLPNRTPMASTPTSPKRPHWRSAPKASSMTGRTPTVLLRHADGVRPVRCGGGSTLASTSVSRDWSRSTLSPLFLGRLP
jgi:hypothetical protein